MKYNDLYVRVCLVGAGDCLVYWVPGADLLLLLGLSGGERIQQAVRHLRRRTVVGNGERTHITRRCTCMLNTFRAFKLHFNKIIMF